MAERPLSRGELCSNVPIASEEVAIGHQTLQTDRPARRQCLSADAHLSSEAVAETIGKSTGAIVVDPCAVNGCQKT